MSARGSRAVLISVSGPRGLRHSGSHRSLVAHVAPIGRPAGAMPRGPRESSATPSSWTDAMPCPAPNGCVLGPPGEALNSPGCRRSGRQRPCHCPGRVQPAAAPALPELPHRPLNPTSQKADVI